MKDYRLYVHLWAYSWGLSKNSPVPFLLTGEWVDFSFQREKKKDRFLAKWRATEEKVTSLRKNREGVKCVKMGYDSITELIIHIQKTELYQRQLYAHSAWQKNKRWQLKACFMQLSII